MSNVLNKFKVKRDLAQSIEQDDQSGGKKNDPRILPYYKLQDGKSLRLLFLPGTNGELWFQYHAHGPNLKGVRGVKSVSCSYKTSGDDCPICQKGFDYLNLAKDAEESGDKAEAKRLKEMAKEWFTKDYTFASVLVLESPFEVPDAPDGNQVKLISLPYKVKEKIKSMIAEGEIDPENIMNVPFRLKKTTVGQGKNAYASYETSFFERSDVEAEDLEFFEDLVVEPYDFDKLVEEFTPEMLEFDEAEEWVKDVLSKKERKAISDEDEDEDNSSKKSSFSRKVKDNIKSRKEEEEEEESDDDDEGEEKQEQQDSKPTSEDKPLSLKERLALKRQRQE